MLTASGHQFMDWSCFYRLFSEQRINIEKLNDVCIENAIEELDDDQMIIAHMDDTVVKKTGKKIPGTSWRRDPLGLPFHTNFIWGQRFIQLSMAIPDGQQPYQSRSIPIGFHHCPTAKKPVKAATQEQIQTYKEEKKQSRLSLQGSLKIKALYSSACSFMLFNFVPLLLQNPQKSLRRGNRILFLIQRSFVSWFPKYPLPAIYFRP